MRSVTQTFGTWLTQRMIDCGHERASDLGRATGINPSLISRWQQDKMVPGMSSLQKLAGPLRTPVQELAARAGHLAGQAPADSAEPERPHPLVLDLARMLAEDSPLPDDEREVLATLVDRVIAPYRRHWRRRRSA